MQESIVIPGEKMHVLPGYIVNPMEKETQIMGGKLIIYLRAAPTIFQICGHFNGKITLIKAMAA